MAGAEMPRPFSLYGSALHDRRAEPSKTSASFVASAFRRLFAFAVAFEFVAPAVAEFVAAGPGSSDRAAVGVALPLRLNL